MKRLFLSMFCLGALSLGSLQADSPAVCQAVAKGTSSLEDARAELKALSKDITDAKIAELVGDVLKKTSKVAKAGKKADSDKAKKALHSVQKVLGVLEQKQMKKKYEKHHSSSSDSSTCDVCSELSDIESDVKHCCKKILKELSEIEKFLEKEFPCNPPIAIDHVPVTIDQSGKYCVTADLFYSGTGAAITVTASNVTINFADHSLTVFNDATDGIEVFGNEFVLENDVIVGPTGATSGAGVHLVGVQKATINNIYVQNFFNCIEIDPSSESLVSQDITIQNSFVQGPNYTGIYVNDANGVTIETCTFDGQNLDAQTVGLWLLNGSQNVIAKDCTLTGWDFGIDCGNEGATGDTPNTTVSNITLEDCLIVGANDDQFSNLLQIGDSLCAANDIIVRNCILSQPNLIQSQDTTFTSGDGLFIQNGQGLILENIVVDTVTTFQTALSYQPAAIHIGCSGCTSCVTCTADGLSYSDILATNVIVRGANDLGLFVENGFDITFDGCQFSSFAPNNIANVQIGSATTTFTPDVVIKNSDILDGDGDGIDIYSTDTTVIENCNVMYHSGNGIALFGDNSTVVNCNIIENGNNGIIINGGPNTVENCNVVDQNGSGIYIAKGADLNTVTNCTVNYNANNDCTSWGIYNDGLNNSITNCVVSNNYGTGILLDVDTKFSYLSDNQVFDNYYNGIENDGKDNAIFNNSSCNNNQSCNSTCLAKCFDCAGSGSGPDDTICSASGVGVCPAQALGDSPVLGANLCCTNSHTPQQNPCCCN